MVTRWGLNENGRLCLASSGKALQCCGFYNPTGIFSIQFYQTLGAWYDTTWAIGDLVSNCWSVNISGCYFDHPAITTRTFPLFFEQDGGSPKLKTFSTGLSDNKVHFVANYYDNPSKNTFRFTIAEVGHADVDGGSISYYTYDPISGLSKTSGITRYLFGEGPISTKRARQYGFARNSTDFAAKTMTIEPGYYPGWGQQTVPYINMDYGTSADGWYFGGKYEGNYIDPIRGLPIPIRIYGGDFLADFYSESYHHYHSVHLYFWPGWIYLRGSSAFQYRQQWPGLRSQTQWETVDQDGYENPRNLIGRLT